MKLSPVVLSSNTPAHVMRSRLNQFKTSGSFKNNVVVSFDGDNGTSISISKAASKKGKKKKAAEI